MNEERARQILGDSVNEDNSLSNMRHYMTWEPGDDDITLDCQFTVEELEAIAWWMRNKTKT